MFKNIFYFIFNKKTEKQKERKKLAILAELIKIKEREAAKESKQYVRNVQEDYYVDSIVVSKNDGEVVMTTEDKAFERAVRSSSLMEYIKSEFPDTTMMIVKDKDKYNVLYTEGDLLYSFNAPGEVSVMETKQIAKQIRAGLKQFPVKKNG